MDISPEPMVVGPNLSFRLLPQEDFLHVECTGDVGLTAFLSGKEPLAEWLGSDVYTKRLLFNFENVQFLDSSGISWLITLQKRFTTKGGLMVLHSVPPLAGEVIQLLQLDRVFKIQPDYPAAQSYFAAAKQ